MESSEVMTKKRKAASPLQPSPVLPAAAAGANNLPREVEMLREEVGKLQRRVMQLEDGMEQRDRLVNLLFSGPAIPEPTEDENTGDLIRALLSTHLSFPLDPDQVAAAFRLQNHKIMVRFKSASPGSDRDKLFRSKTKLKGTGLFIAESLTRVRQETFQALLRLKKGRVIHTVFTESGSLLVRRTPGSTPIKITDSADVEELAKTAPLPVQPQGRPEAAESEAAAAASPALPRSSTTSAKSAPAPPSPEQSIHGQ